MTNLKKVTIHELADKNPDIWSLMLYGIPDKGSKKSGGLSAKINYQAEPMIEDHIATIMGLAPGWFKNKSALHRAAAYVGFSVILDIMQRKDDPKVKALRATMEELNENAAKLRVDEMLKNIDKQITDLRNSNVPNKEKRITKLQKRQTNILAEF